MGILQTSEPVELPDSLRWRYVKFGQCVSVGPFIVGGPTLGFECHHPFKRTLPCYRFLKGCTLDCPRCRYRRQFTSYVPLIETGEPLRLARKVITGGKKVFNAMKQFAPGDLVSLSKGTHVKDTYIIRPWAGEVDPRQLAAHRKFITEDISPYLFHLWQQRELTEFFKQTYYPSLKAQENGHGADVPTLDELRGEQ